MQQSMDKMENWIAIESDPSIWNHYLQQLGANHHRFQFQELISVQQDFITHDNILGVVLAYDETQKQVDYQKQEKQNLNLQKFIEVQQEQSLENKTYFMTQYADNACGSVAIYHIIFNNINEYKDLVMPNSHLAHFFLQTSEKSPSERGLAFLNSQDTKKLHMKYSAEGQSQIHDQVNEHYAAFIHKNGKLLQLDGCKQAPVVHNQCTRQNMMSEALNVIRKIMMRDPQSLNYSVMMLTQI